MSVRFHIVIPARFGASRLPGKPLRLLGGQPLVCHVVARAQAAGAERVVVATDDARIAEAVAKQAVEVCMTRADHPSGTDRLAEVADQLGFGADQIIVNLQGDEPFAPVSGLRRVAEALAASSAPMATLATPITSTEELFAPSCVKLVCTRDGRALYFSRSPLPHARDAFAASPNQLPLQHRFLRHIGVYAYRAGFLARFVAMPPGDLERAESLEQLRVLEAGESIQVALAPEPFPPGVDTEDDLRRAEAMIEGRA